MYETYNVMGTSNSSSNSTGKFPRKLHETLLEPSHSCHFRMYFAEVLYGTQKGVAVEMEIRREINNSGRYTTNH